MTDRLHWYIAAAICLFALTALAEPVVDVPAIAGKDAAGVAAVLGPAVDCEPVEQGEKCAYAPGETEVVFIDEKADWITVNELIGVAYSDAAIGALGFAPAAPAFVGPDALRWNRIQGIREVSVFKGDRGSIFYAYIQVTTP